MRAELRDTGIEIAVERAEEAARLQAGTVESRGHWRDIGDGIQVVLRSQALLAVLVVAGDVREYDGLELRRVADLAALRPHLAAHEQSDIPDPLGQSKEFFAMVGSQIADLLPPILELCRRS